MQSTDEEEIENLLQAISFDKYEKLDTLIDKVGGC